MLIIVTSLSSDEQNIIYIFGGPNTQEGKFEDEWGNPDMQGWECIDLPLDVSTHWHLSTFNSEGFVGPLNNHVLWCGSSEYECNDEPAPGYGNDWEDCIDWFGSVH